MVLLIQYWILFIGVYVTFIKLKEKYLDIKIVKLLSIDELFINFYHPSELIHKWEERKPY